MCHHAARAVGSCSSGLPAREFPNLNHPVLPIYDSIYCATYHDPRVLSVELFETFDQVPKACTFEKILPEFLERHFDTIPNKNQMVERNKLQKIDR